MFGSLDPGTRHVLAIGDCANLPFRLPTRLAAPMQRCLGRIGDAFARIGLAHGILATVVLGMDTGHARHCHPVCLALDACESDSAVASRLDESFATQQIVAVHLLVGTTQSTTGMLACSGPTSTSIVRVSFNRTSLETSACLWRKKSQDDHVDGCAIRTGRPCGTSRLGTQSGVQSSLGPCGPYGLVTYLCTGSLDAQSRTT